MIEQHELGEAYARSTDPGTSHAAAMSVRGKEATRMETIVLNALADSPEGLTTHELEQKTGIARVSVSPRLRPLVEKGKVVDSGNRRVAHTGRRCIVWKAVVKGNI